MPAKGKGNAVRSGPRIRGSSLNDAEQALQDALAEVDDMTSVIDSAPSAGGTAGAAPLPAALLERRLSKVTTEKEKAIKENELLQKQVEEMRAELELSKAKVGDVVQVPDTAAAPARKVRLLPKFCWQTASAVL